MAAGEKGGEADDLVVPLADEAGLSAVAETLSDTLPERACLALHGDLGAGKTTLVKALAAAAGIDPGTVVSPTFGLIHLHDLAPGHPAGRLVHADLYRLAGPGDLDELGWDELLSAPGWLAVEWPSRAAGALPADRLDVTIGIEGPTARRLSFAARGPRHRPVIAALSRLPGAVPCPRR